MYELLTMCEVKMAGYWPSSFFTCLWTETESRFIDSWSWPYNKFNFILEEMFGFLTLDCTSFYEAFKVAGNSSLLAQIKLVRLVMIKVQGNSHLWKEKTSNQRVVL